MTLKSSKENWDYLKGKCTIVAKLADVYHNGRVSHYIISTHMVCHLRKVVNPKGH